MSTAAVALRRNGTILEVRYVTDVSVAVQFILVDTPGSGNHTYDILVDTGTAAVGRRDMIATVQHK